MAKLTFRLTLLLGGVFLGLLMGIRRVDWQQGNPAHGAKILANGYLQCGVCHTNKALAPPMQGIASRVAQVRLAAAANADKTAAQYLAESILFPNLYVVPEYATNAMPPYRPCPYDCRGIALSIPDLQDLVAYLMTI